MATLSYHKLPEYSIWTAMRQRCLNRRCKKYPAYGGRGIKVCERWCNFPAFLEDVGRRPSAAHSLHRDDNNGHYEPGNVVWATRVEQQNNTRKNHLLTWHERTMTTAQWARETGIPYGIVLQRLNRLGWSTDMALSTPVNHRGRVLTDEHKRKISEGVRLWNKKRHRHPV